MEEEEGINEMDQKCGKCKDLKSRSQKSNFSCQEKDCIPPSKKRKMKNYYF